VGQQTLRPFGLGSGSLIISSSALISKKPGAPQVSIIIGSVFKVSFSRPTSPVNGTHFVVPFPGRLEELSSATYLRATNTWLASIQIYFRSRRLTLSGSARAEFMSMDASYVAREGDKGHNFLNRRPPSGKERSSSRKDSIELNART